MTLEQFENLVAVGFGVRIAKQQAASVVAEITALRSRLRESEEARADAWACKEAADAMLGEEIARSRRWKAAAKVWRQAAFLINWQWAARHWGLARRTRRALSRAPVSKGGAAPEKERATSPAALAEPPDHPAPSASPESTTPDCQGEDHSATAPHPCPTRMP
jgi:hypothetical protein